MKLKLFLFIMSLIISDSFAQTNHLIKESYRVEGNCNQCKKRIETAGYIKNGAKTVWDVNSKMATLTFNANKTNADALLKKIALSGHDNDHYLTTPEIYAQLPACCQYERKQANIKQASPNIQTPPDSNASTRTTAETKSGFDDLYATYFLLKDAFVQSKLSATTALSKQLLVYLPKVKTEQLNAQQSSIWKLYQLQLSDNLTRINNAANINSQRKLLVVLSETMYALMKEIKPATTVYYQHCAMFNNGEGGYWISKEAAIKNPYYGNEMLTCGSVEATLKP